jgi:hypothetical protein
MVGINMFSNACIFLGFDNFPSLGTMNPKIICENCSQCVPNKFPSYFHQVPKMFLTSCSQRHSQYLAPHFFNPILFGHGSTPMDISCKRGATGKHDKTCFYFGEESLYVGGAPSFKNICDGPIK